MKQLTKEMVEFTIETQDELIPVQDALSVKETGVNHSKYIEKVLNDNGFNPWLWCCVKVTAIFKEISASSYLGQCAYNSKEDFIKGGYYEQMQDEAFEDLKIKVDEILTALK